MINIKEVTPEINKMEAEQTPRCAKYNNPNLLILGTEFVTSRQSKALSQDSIGSAEAYLIDSLSSIFLKIRPALKSK